MADHASPVRIAGLPPGVAPGPLGTRFVAYLIDAVVPALIALLTVGLMLQTNLSPTVLALISLVLIVAWGLLVWWMFAVGAAGPGMRLMRLQLVGLANGRAIGWGRFLIRQLILFALELTGIGLLLMVIFLVRQPRRQGWQDLAVDAVVIKERQLSPRRSTARARHAGPPAVGAPPPVAAPGAAPPATSAPPPDATPPPSGVAAPGAPPATAPMAGAMSTGAPTPLSPPPGYPAPPDQSRPGGARSAGPQPADLSQQAPPRQAPPPPTTRTPAAAEPGQAPIQSPDRPWPPAGSPDLAPRPPAGPQPTGTAPAAARGPWRAVLDDGRELPVDGLVLLGRNPQPRPGEEHATLIKIADTTRTVSKSHLEIGLDPTGLYVLDRGSTNGSTVTSVSGVSRRCAPGDRVTVQPGSIVSFGDHWLELRRADEG